LHADGGQPDPVCICRLMRADLPLALDVPNVTDAQQRKRKPDYQVSVHLNASERSRFDDYSRTFGLDAAGLMALLIAREMRVGRLAGCLTVNIDRSKPFNSKVTVHVRNADERTAVMKLLSAGKQRAASAGGARLALAELEERWLERVLATRFESPRKQKDATDVRRVEAGGR
jgi:hypothetical protein